MKVLLVARSDDNASVDWLETELRKRRATPIRLNTDLYPQGVQLSTTISSRPQRYRLNVGAKSWDLSDLGAMWYRRFVPGVRLSDSLGDLRPASVEESKRTLQGSLAALHCFHLDSIHSVREADYKELQLHRAVACGLDVPRSLYSNDPREVRRFYDACKGQIITKMQASFAVYRNNQELVVFTNKVLPEHLEALDGLDQCPMTFQELLPKKLELRATVVGRRVFTAAVDSQATGKSDFDWRQDGIGLLKSWRHYRLPRPVEQGLLRLTRWYGLNYAAADFVVTPKGRHVFLEINAVGEFFWLQQAPGLPIVEALADVLLQPSKRVRAGRNTRQ